MNGETVWLRIASCSDIPAREGRAVRIGNREIAIFNLGHRFLAVDNRCPHRGGPLADGIVSGANVVCPLHAWKFNLETGVGVSAPSQGSCVENFSTRVEDGIVLLELPIATEAKQDVSIGSIDREPVQPWGWKQSVRVIDEM